MMINIGRRTAEVAGAEVVKRQKSGTTRRLTVKDTLQDVLVTAYRRTGRRTGASARNRHDAHGRRVVGRCRRVVGGPGASTATSRLP